jgi:hypothetical protein
MRLLDLPDDKTVKETRSDVLYLTWRRLGTWISERYLHRDETDGLYGCSKIAYLSLVLYKPARIP